jgi:hypothetical protein
MVGSVVSTVLESELVAKPLAGRPSRLLLERTLEGSLLESPWLLSDEGTTERDELDAASALGAFCNVWTSPGGGTALDVCVDEASPRVEWTESDGSTLDGFVEEP